jgi:hypothetical protein
MTRTAGACVALFLACAACGEDNVSDEQVTPPAAEGGAQSTGSTDAAASGSDAGPASAKPEASTTTDASSKPASDAGSTAPAKDAATKPQLDLMIPMASMQCGGSACDLGTKVCCESWSKGTGFGTTQSCVTRDECNKKYSRSGEQNRAIPHECDGKEDCSGGQVCCMYAAGMPLCDDITNCLNTINGPGGSGICADNDLCKVGSTQFIAEGVPLGVLACNDDVDCADRSNTSCKPEESNSATTGKGISARAYVKVCR